MSRSLELSLFDREREFPTERANQLTHGAGLVLSLLGAAAMLAVAWQTRDPWRMSGCAIFVASLVALYAASTLSHSFDEGPMRVFYRMLDQVCILLFIGGSFTAFTFVHLRTPLGWGLLAGLWLVVLIGTIWRIARPHKTLPILLFVPIGWMPVLTIGRMYEVGQAPGLFLVIAGGLAYTCGVWFLLNDHRRPWYHAVWHLSTMAGAICHYCFMYEFVARVTG